MSSAKKVNVNEMDYGKWNECDRLRTERKKLNMNIKMWTDENKMKHEVSNVTSPTLSSKTLQVGQKYMLHSFLCVFLVYKITPFAQIGI